MALLKVLVSTVVALFGSAMTSSFANGMHISLVQLRGQILQKASTCFELKSEYGCPCECMNTTETVGDCEDVICDVDVDDNIHKCYDNLSMGDLCVPTNSTYAEVDVDSGCIYAFICSAWPTMAPPTPVPTPEPTTPAPTPEPTVNATDTVKAIADPHMVNIRGEHFNIWRLGEVELLKVPRGATLSTVGLYLVANVSDVDQQAGTCAKAPYMTAMRLGGSWFGKNETREISIKMVDGEMEVFFGEKSIAPDHPRRHHSLGNNVTFSRPSEGRVTVNVAQASIDVTHDKAHKPHFYLNTEAHNLRSLGFDIGGILGLDDHTVLASKPDVCAQPEKTQRHRSKKSHSSTTQFDELQDPDESFLKLAYAIASASLDA